MNESEMIAGLAKQVARLARRVELLERDSHPPINLEPAIIEIIERRAALTVTSKEGV